MPLNQAIVNELKALMAHADELIEAINSGGGSGVSSFNTRTGAVTPQSGDYSSFYLVALSGVTAYTGYGPAYSFFDGAHAINRTSEFGAWGFFANNSGISPNGDPGQPGQILASQGRNGDDGGPAGMQWTNGTIAIDTVGTINTGTWHGTILEPGWGGTGNDNSTATAGHSSVFGSGGTLGDSGFALVTPPLPVARPPNTSDTNNAGPIVATGGTFVDGSNDVTTLSFTPIVSGLAATSCPAIADGTVSTVNSATEVHTSNNASVQITDSTAVIGPLSATITDGSAVVLVADTTGMNPGDTITGTGVPGGTTISTVDSGTQITLSANIVCTISLLNLAFVNGNEVTFNDVLYFCVDAASGVWSNAGLPITGSSGGTINDNSSGGFTLVKSGNANSTIALEIDAPTQASFPNSNNLLLKNVTNSDDGWGFDIFDSGFGPAPKAFFFNYNGTSTYYVFGTEGSFGCNNSSNVVIVSWDASGNLTATSFIGDGTSLTGVVLSSLLGANNGVATLDSGGTLSPSQIPAAFTGALTYQGVWDANTNTPTLTSSTGTKGFYYRVSVAGTTNLDGNNNWDVGDSAIFDGSVWQAIGNDVVLSGDVTGPDSSTTVALVGGSTAGNVHAAELLANAATNTNTASTIVKRDGSGNFSAGTITASLTGNATGFTGSLTGDVTGTQGATVVANVGGQAASAVASATATTGARFDTAGHLSPPAGTPAIATGTGAGTIGTPTASVAGKDESMVLTVNTATAPLLSGTVATITFNAAWATAPKSVVLTPANLATLLLGVASCFVDPASISTTQFAVTASSTALTGATTYKWHCQAK